MAWASVGRAGSTGNTGNNQATIDITLNGQVGTGANVSDVLIATFSCDNDSTTTSGIDPGAVSGVVDSASNNWIKAREIQNGGGLSQSGAVCSIWYTHVDNALSTAAVVTASLTNNTFRDATAGIVWRFTNGTGALSLEETTFVTLGTSSCGSLDIDTSAKVSEHLRFRGVAAETTVTAFTTTAGWTTIGTTRSGTAVGAEVAVFGEFLISSSANAPSNPSISAAADQASILCVFENADLMGDQAID